MRSVVTWTETPPEKDGVKNVCYDLCFKPDGSQLVAAVGARVLVFDAATGELLHALKGHKGAVYCVAYAWSGKRFASGGADKTVIVWTSKAEGILKYTHGDAIQCLSYNPVTHQLASGTAGDLGLWSPEQKAVTKHKVPSKILCADWTADGSLLALGCYDGGVSIRDRAGNERVRVAAAATPVWCLAWSPQDPPVLAVGCLDGRLRFFTAGGTQKHKDREIEGDPLTMAFFSGKFLFVAGSDKSIHMFTKDGVPLSSVPGCSSWIWRLAVRPRANYLAVGCEDGSVSALQLVFSTVHGLYGDRYAFRDAMTDVIIQHLITEQKVRIKARDYVKKVAVYRDRVAVQLPSRVVLYELTPPADGAPVDDTNMQYRSAAKISAAWDCNLLVVTSANLVLCQDKKLQLYDFEGAKQREWCLDAVIRYIKVAGGPPRREALLVGLKNGQIVKVFIDNPFPIPLIAHGCGVRCLDVSPGRGQLALVDEQSKVVVYDLESKAVTFEAEGANSVAWNADCESMFCYSGGGSLVIKTGTFPPHSQRMQGFVVGFKGSKVFCLQSASMQTIDVPQSASMFRYLEQKDWAAAHSVACLGVTEGDWRALALAALEAMELEVARAAFVRVRDHRAVELVDRIAAGVRGGVARGLLLGDALAWQGRHGEAARCYVNEGRLDKALDMFTALRQFDEAKKWADDYARSGRGAGGGRDTAAVSDLIGRQAEWSEESANYEAAVEMYAKARRFDRAVALVIRHAWWERLLGLVRSMSKDQHALLIAAAAAALAGAGAYGAAKEALLKIDDAAGLADLAVRFERWEDAELMAAAAAGGAARVRLPHAAWLAARDRFDEARAAYRAAGRPDLGRSLLEGLADAAVRSCRFKAASEAHYKLAADALQDVANPPGALTAADAAALARFSAAYDAAELYAAYDVIHQAAVQPFTTTTQSTLLGAARFLLARVIGRPAPPPGVSVGTALLALARGAAGAGAWRTARGAYTRLQALALPPYAAADVELQSVLIRAKPFSDPEGLSPPCFRCGGASPLLPPAGSGGGGGACGGCGAAFVVSPLTWEVLPAVEFELEEGITEAEALELIGEGIGDDALADLASSSGGAGGSGGSSSGGGGGANVLRLEDDGPPGGLHGGGGGAGAAALEESWAAQALVPHAPIRLDRAALRQLAPTAVLRRRLPGAAPGLLPCQWFRVVDEEAALAVGPWGQIWEEEEAPLETSGGGGGGGEAQ